MSNTQGRVNNAIVSPCSDIERMLALRRNAEPVDDDVLTSSGIIHLKNKTTDELLAMQKFPQDQLKRYEQALRTATPVLNERKQ